MCITVLCNKTLPKMYQIIPKMYFLAINGKQKNSFCEKPHTLHFISQISSERKRTCDLFCYVELTAKPSSLVFVGQGGGDQSIQMEVVFLRFLFNSNEK